jgi:hypothetical protein
MSSYHADVLVSRFLSQHVGSGRSHSGTLKNKRELGEMVTHAFAVVEERIIVKGPIVN